VRKELPNRRELLTETIRFSDDPNVEGAVIHVSVGHVDGVVREIFLSGPKTGTGLRSVIEDAAVLASHAMQRGAPLGELASSMSRVPRYQGASEPGSPIAAALSWAVTVQDRLDVLYGRKTDAGQ